MATIVLKDKYIIKKFNEDITLTEALDTVAYTATIKLALTSELEDIGLLKGDKIEIIDLHAELKTPATLFNGVVWEIRKSKKSKTMTLTCKERTIYIEESEDEYLLSEGQTATQRIAQYCSDWGIPTASLVDTVIKLSKAMYRKETIFGMMLKDLKETVQKGGELYKVRMLDKLNILKLGINATVWKLGSIVDEIEESSSLEGTVTQVKVLGKNDKDENKSPIIGTYKKDTDKYGTIQKLVQDEKVTSVEQAQQMSNTLFNDGEESINISCAKDINTIRAGDRIELNSVFYYVTDITHNLVGTGNMTMSLGKWDYVRRKFYA